MEKDTCPNFFYTLYKAPKKSESSFSHPFLAVFPLLALKVLISQNGQTHANNSSANCKLVDVIFGITQKAL